MDSPTAERLDLVDDLFGHQVADPYRWLEDVEDPRTQAWRTAQQAVATEHLSALPGRDTLRARLTDLLSAGAVGVPAWRAGRPFWSRRSPGQEHACLLTRDPDGTERVLLDPMQIDPSGGTTLDAWAPSKEGDRLAYQLSTGGDEESVLWIVDVTTGEVLDGPVDRCRYSPVAWEPGGKALFYVRREPGPDQLHRRVRRHVVGTDPSQDTTVWGEGLDPTNYYGCSVSADGRWLLVTASAGTAPRDDVWLFDLLAGGPPAEVQVGVDARCSPWIAHDGRLWMLTDVGAPRGRLCVADPVTPTGWTTVVAEDEEAVLEDVLVLGGGDLVVLRSRHAGSELSVVSGGVETAQTLPGFGTVTALSGLPEGGAQAWYGWTDTVSPPRVHTLDGAVWASPSSDGAAGPHVAPPAVHARLLEATSADGTIVRLQVLSPAGEPQARPTVLYGYGGFGVSLTPAYTAGALAWVAAGGVWAVANLRGGSEEGEAWHRAGMRENKQHCFDDFAACADLLVDQGWTTRSQLGIYGGSNGGLLVGATLTQRPEAQAAAVCSAPLLDMVRYERFGLGITWNDEYGTAADPTELGWLLGYSPYHHAEVAAYPAVLFTVFDGDSRVDPLHARKMCAALQHATTADAPVLLRDETGVGHGARSVSRTVGLSVDVLAFLAHHTGLAL